MLDESPEIAKPSQSLSQVPEGHFYQTRTSVNVLKITIKEVIKDIFSPFVQLIVHSVNRDWITP